MTGMIAEPALVPVDVRVDARVDVQVAHGTGELLNPNWEGDHMQAPISKAGRELST